MSNRVIHKAVVDRESGALIPSDAVPLSAQLQHGRVTVWYTTVNNLLDSRRVFYVGTGHVINDGHAYVGTVQDGSLVWHVFLERAT